ncbi:MAG: hypothetical protein JWM80_6360 [Cyanobacteria bacterium RYN_339]|nr:hypothetical protein [Cyanobacteria bacterium RYN_339]
MSVPSPCVNVCQLDPTGRVCLGCFRNLAEIGGWMGMDDQAKRKALQACDRRRQERAAQGGV